MYHAAQPAMSTQNPHSVFEGLKEQAQQKASLRMFYSAADLLRDYKGPYAQETAVDREKLAGEYHEMAKAAEEARLTGAGRTVPTPPSPRPAPPARASKPAPPAKAKPATPRPAAAPRPAAKPATPKTPAYQREGDMMTFTCRWCKEPVSLPVAEAGKFMPCPKCDNLLSVPKL